MQRTEVDFHTSEMIITQISSPTGRLTLAISMRADRLKQPGKYLAECDADDDQGIPRRDIALEHTQRLASASKPDREAGAASILFIAGQSRAGAFAGPCGRWSESADRDRSMRRFAALCAATKACVGSSRRFHPSPDRARPNARSSLSGQNGQGSPR